MLIGIEIIIIFSHVSTMNIYCYNMFIKAVLAHGIQCQWEVYKMNMRSTMYVLNYLLPIHLQQTPQNKHISSKSKIQDM